jgi:hypothetical protein
VVPYDVGTEEFFKMFVLVDGIYPPLSRFVRGIAQPIGDKEDRFTCWQESTRKDIERAFGVLQHKFQFMARPIMLMDTLQIGQSVRTCLILHNMCMSDRVMDSNVYVRYDLANECYGRIPNLENPVLAHEDIFPKIGIANLPRNNNVQFVLELLLDKDENNRLQRAISDNLF